MAAAASDYGGLWAGRPYPRVLHVIASLAVGGTERQLVQFINRSSCPERHFVALFDELGPLADGVPNPPVVLGRVRRSLSGAASSLTTLVSLRRTIGAFRIELVHAHLGISELLAALAAPARVPVVASRRGRNVGFEERTWMRVVEGIGHRGVDVMICNSTYLAERTRRLDLWPPPITVIHNAVDLQTHELAPMPPRHPPTVAVVANFHPYKRHEDFLRAFALAVQKLPDARALLVGDGRERGRLERLVGELGLGANVSFVGQVGDPRPHVASAHLVALTSDHEGFPNALLEAMAQGRPVVATRVGGIAELVRDGVDGFLVPRGPDLVAERMVALLSDENLRARMGREARRRAERFTWDRVVRETEAVYRMVLDTRARNGNDGG